MNSTVIKKSLDLGKDTVKFKMFMEVANDGSVQLIQKNNILTGESVTICQKNWKEFTDKIPQIFVERSLFKKRKEISRRTIFVLKCKKHGDILVQLIKYEDDPDLKIELDIVVDDDCIENGVSLSEKHFYNIVKHRSIK